MKQLDILSMISSDRYSGPAVPALQQLELLQQSGHRVTFICLPGGSLAEKAEQKGISTVTNIPLPRQGEIWQFPFSLHRLKKLLDQSNRDCLLVHKTVETVIAGWVCGNRLPVLRIWHQGDARPPGRMISHILRRYHIKAAGTSATASAALGELALIRNNQPLTLPTAVDIDRFHPGLDGQLVREKLGLKLEQVLLGIIARWKPGRELRRFLDIFAKAAEQNSHLYACLIGAGELEDNLKSHARYLGIQSRVFFLIPENHFPETAAAMDIGCLLRPGSDGSARAVLEMMAMGKPVVLANQGSLNDYTGEKTGCLSGNNDEEMISAILQLTENNCQRRELGNIARKYVERYHAPDIVKEKLLQQLSLMICSLRQSSEHTLS